MTSKILNIKTSLRQIFIGLVTFLLAATAVADHALLANGKILYNVSVPDGATTGGALIRIRTGQGSFGFDPATNTIYSLPPYAISERVADYISTSEQVGRQQATNIFKQKRWNTYQPALARETPLVMPPPAPKLTPVPVVVAEAAATPVPLNVVPATLPLDQRLDRQLDIFMKEQMAMTHDAVTSVSQGILTQDQANQRKVDLLIQQKRILEQFFPQTTDTVRLAIKYWGEQTTRAQQTGKFDLENL